MNVKVSVIIPFYNTKMYLKKCLDSIMNQNLKEIEIIIVNDCSEDDPENVLNEYLNDKRVTIINHKTRKAAGGARNTALKIAKGEFISFIDSDDWVDINFIKTLYTAAIEYDADISMSGLIREYDVNRAHPVYKCKYDDFMLLNSDVAFRIMTNEYKYGFKIIPSALNKLYKKDFLLKNNITFIENILFEDQLFSYQVMLCANNILCVPGTLYHHYKRTGSIVQSFSKKNIVDLDYSYQEIKKYLIEKDLFNRYKNNYYSSLTHFYNLIIREIFEFVKDEHERKKWMRESFQILKNNVNIEEYIEYCSAEQIRQHLQPNIKTTKID